MTLDDGKNLERVTSCDCLGFPIQKKKDSIICRRQYFGNDYMKRNLTPTADIYEKANKFLVKVAIRKKTSFKFLNKAKILIYY